MHNCLPWFILKKAQAELLIQLQEHIDETRQGRGRSVSEDSHLYREDIHRRVKKLNRKGPVDISIKSED